MSKHVGARRATSGGRATPGRRARTSTSRETVGIRLVSAALVGLLVAGGAWELGLWSGTPDLADNAVPAAAQVAEVARTPQASVPGFVIDLDPTAWATTAARVVRKAATPQRVHDAPTLARSAEWVANQQTLTFKVATFNVLGAGHTQGNSKRARRYAAGSTRMGWGTSIIGSLGLDVVGFQELQSSQYGVVRSRMPGWGLYPGAALGQSAMANSIAWDTSKWTAVETHTIAIPYFGGRPVQMPYVLLRDDATGRQVWFANFHNPADAHGNAQRWRNAAVQKEIALAAQLSADGTPVIMTGDMNDRAPYFCPMTASGAMHAAIGGSIGTPCVMPRRTRVDWVMGSRDVDFTEYGELDSGLVTQVTDHPVVYAGVSIAPAGQ